MVLHCGSYSETWSRVSVTKFKSVGQSVRYDGWRGERLCEIRNIIKSFDLIQSSWRRLWVVTFFFFELSGLSYKFVCWIAHLNIVPLHNAFTHASTFDDDGFVAIVWQSATNSTLQKWSRWLHFRVTFQKKRESNTDLDYETQHSSLHQKEDRREVKENAPTSVHIHKPQVLVKVHRIIAWRHE